MSDARPVRPSHVFFAPPFFPVDGRCAPFARVTRVFRPSSPSLANFDASHGFSFEVTWKDEINYSYSWGDVFDSVGRRIKKAENIPEAAAQAALQFCAKLMICRGLAVVRERIAKLSDKSRVVPLEHLEAASGSLDVMRDLRVLASIRKHDVELLEKHHDKIVHELSRGMFAAVPPLHDSDAGRAQLKCDVHEFVQDYLSLLHLRSFCVPRLGDRCLLPEDVIADVDVLDDARGVKSSHSKRRCRHVLETDRRERDIVARVMGELTMKVVVAGIACVALPIFLLSLWLCYKAVEGSLRSVGVRGAALYYLSAAGALCLCLLSMRASLLLLKTPFDMPKDATPSQMIWRLLHAINDRWALFNGQPLPIAQKVAKLEARCGRVIASWTIRAARERYFQALKRKRISSKAADLLLRDLAAESVGQQGGTLPGTVEEAEAFLNLAVDEEACNSEDSSREALMDAIKAAMKPIDKPLLMASAHTSRADKPPEFEVVGARVEVLSPHDRAGAVGSVSLVLADWVVVQLDGHRHPDQFMCGSLRALAEPKSSPAKRPIFQKQAADHENENVAPTPTSADEAEPQEKPTKVRTIEEALRAGGWQFKRQRKHIIYERTLTDETGAVRREVITRARTPSDCRSNKNLLAGINRLNATPAQNVTPASKPKPKQRKHR